MDEEKMLKLIKNGTFEDIILVLTYMVYNWDTEKIMDFFVKNGDVHGGRGDSMMTPHQFQTRLIIKKGWEYRYKNDVGFYIGSSPYYGVLQLYQHPHSFYHSWNPQEL